MSDARLGIIIEAFNRTQNALDGAKSGLGQLDNAAKVANAGITSLVTGMVGGFALFSAGHAIEELTMLGAQAERADAAFRSTAKQYNANADEMLMALRAASRGTVTDQELMLSANKAMMLGVTNDAETMAKLLAAAAQRGKAMGRSTSEAFGDIVMGIGRLSPLILDNLGIIVGGEKAYEAYAKSINKTAAELTDVERRQMLVNKVLAQSTAGGAADAKATITQYAVALQFSPHAWG